MIAHWFTTGWERGEVVKVYNTGKNRFVVKYKWGDGSRLTHGCFEADYRKHWVTLMPQADAARKRKGRDPRKPVSTAARAGKARRLPEKKRAAVHDPAGRPPEKKRAKAAGAGAPRCSYHRRSPWSWGSVPQ